MRRIAALVALVTATSLGAEARPAERSFVDAETRVPGLRVDMRYAGANNFVGRPIAGYEAPRCLLTPQAAEALRAAQAALAREGFGLKVFDCYRPVRAVADFLAWARDPADVRMKADYYPEFSKPDLFRRGYIAGKSAHSRGSTVDLTLVRLSDGSELDMGTPFDFFGPTSAPGSAAVSAAQAGNRTTLRRAMIRAGFQPYAQEWWHFTLRNEPHPRTPSDVPVR